MNKAIQILRHHFDSKLSNEKIALAVGVSKGSVNNCLQRFKNSNSNWSEAKNLTEVELEKILFPENIVPPNSSIRKGEVYPDYNKIKHEMQRPHVTLQLLYEEFKKEFPASIGRSQFYDGYKRHIKNSKIEMHVDHKAGDKFFVDYSGDSIGYYDRDKGEYVDTELFVGTWGASCFTYAEASESQNTEEWVYSHVRAFNYSGCSPAALVPDNLKSAVIKPCIYDPNLNPLYEKMAEHYGCAVLPARVRKPQDKGIVENHVLHIQHYILGRLRNHKFYSLAEVNNAIREQLNDFNDQPMKGYGDMSRRELFLELDKKHAQSLPVEAFEITYIKQGLRVAPNYHIQFKKHHYSLSHTLVGELVDVYQKGSVIEVYHKGVHIARHQKSSKRHGYTTRSEHMPKAHEYVKGWSVPWFMAKAEEVGPQTAIAIKKLFETNKHPEQGYRSARGILALAGEYGSERMENASKRALRFNSTTFNSIKNILIKELDKKEPEVDPQAELNSIEEHDNIRGPKYYEALDCTVDQEVQ